MIRAGVGESYMITLAASVEEPHAPTVNGSAVNAFEYLVRHRQSAHPRASAHLICRVVGSANIAKGVLGLRLQVFLEQCGAGYSASDTPIDRKSLCFAVKWVFWAVSPNLKKSLQADCGISSQACHCRHWRIRLAHTDLSQV